MKTIKTKLHPVSMAVALLLFYAAPLGAARYIVGISPYYEVAHRDLVLREVLRFVLDTADPGEEVLVYDALGQQPVTQFLIPEGKVFKANPRARLERLKGEIAACKQFLSIERPHSPDMKNVINIPQFLQLAGSQLRKKDQLTSVILLASPFHMDQEESSFNLNDAYPSDAHLTADPRDSVFSTVHRKNALSGIAVHYAYFQDCFVNDFHRERIGRFYVLMIGSQGGVLATFAPTVALAFSRAKEHVREPFIRAEFNAQDTKLEMRPAHMRTLPPLAATPPKPVEAALVVTPKAVEAPRVVEPAVSTTMPVIAVAAAPVVPVVKTNEVLPSAKVTVDIKVTAATNSVPLPPQTPPMATNSATAVPEQVATNVATKTPSLAQQLDTVLQPLRGMPGGLGIAITWNVPVDCDLYVKPSRDAKEISYRRRVTKEGRFFYDQRHGGGAFYEYIEMTRFPAFDLRDIRAWVNLYAGSAPAVRGTVVIFYNARTYEAEFQLASHSGNEGKDASKRDKSSYWCEIDVAGIIGLSPSRRIAPGQR